MKGDVVEIPEYLVSFKVNHSELKELESEIEMIVQSGKFTANKLYDLLQVLRTKAPA